MAAALSAVQMEIAQPPSMMEKQMKTSKAKPEKKVKEAAESPAKETGPVPAQPAQSLEGKSFGKQCFNSAAAVTVVTQFTLPPDCSEALGTLWHECRDV